MSYGRAGFGSCLCFFFFNDTATTEIYTLSLHDALPICARRHPARGAGVLALRRGGGPERAGGPPGPEGRGHAGGPGADRKSTRLNSSHANISYAVFCLKKKKSYQSSTLTPYRRVINTRA